MPLGMVLRATEFRAMVPYLAAAVVVVLAFPEGVVSRLGPVTFTPSVPVVLLAPLLLSFGVGVAHSTWPVPVVARNRRTLVARAVSCLLALACSLAVVAVAAAVSDAVTFAALVRVLCVLSALTMAVGALAGIVHAWLPAVLVSGAALLSGASERPFTLYAMLLDTRATAGQTVLAVTLLAVGGVICLLDPMSRGYLVTAGAGRRAARFALLPSVGPGRVRARRRGA